MNKLIRHTYNTVRLNIRFNDIRINQFHLKSSSSYNNNYNNDEKEHFLLGDIHNKTQIDRDTFLFGQEGERTTYSSLGISTALCTALELTGKLYPTSIQVKTFPSIKNGIDVIIGAETGSGKTLSYLLPIIQDLLDQNKVKNEIKDKILNTDTPAENEQNEIDENVMYVKTYPSIVIMVPTKELCSQVYKMTGEILRNIPEKHNINLGLFTSLVDKWPYTNEQVFNYFLWIKCMIISTNIYVIFSC